MSYKLIAQGVQYIAHPATPGSSFALPGWHLTPAWLNNSYYVRWVVDQNFDVWIALDGGAAWTRVHPNDYPSICVARAQNWSWSINPPNAAALPPGAVMLASANINARSGNYYWGLPSIGGVPNEGGQLDGRLHRIANLTELGWSKDAPRDAYIYVSGIGSYEVTDPIYPSPAQIVIAGVRAPILDYYPFAKWDGGSWQSCNRRGGYVRKSNGSAWVDLKNYEDNGGNSKIFLANSNGTWRVAPKIGNNREGT